MHRSQLFGKKYVNDEGYHCKKFSTSRSIQLLASQGLVYCSTVLAFGQDKDPLPYPASEIVVLATPGRYVNQLISPDNFQYHESHSNKEFYHCSQGIVSPPQFEQ